MLLTEEEFRALLDERGHLRPGALALPDRERTYAVFAQWPDRRLDIEAIKRQGAQFFATRIGMTVEKHYDIAVPSADAARIVVAAADGSVSGTRLCYGRAVEASDLIAAEEAERAMGTYGMALLARRCKTLWMVVPDGHEDDRAALAIAAIFASVALGPILPPGGREILGVRSARAKVEGSR